VGWLEELRDVANRHWNDRTKAQIAAHRMI
jgi:hypothetical protein